MLIDNLFDRLVRHVWRSRKTELAEELDIYGQASTRKSKSNSNRRQHGVFESASDFIVNNPIFIENNISAGKPVLELILPHTDPHAAVDSSARFPPPLCHPGTRLKIGARLESWLTDPERQWNMIWLYGPAATGKSAVAQTFAERCVESGRLGAAFFFSRPNKRNNPERVIPSLIYQLAVRVPSYKSIVATQLANDPQLMWKARHIQFRKLIVEPFLSLQTQGQNRIEVPLLVVLDGLDECKEESAQREIVEMISEVTRLKKDLPLLWLICSRPEAHIKYVFSRVDYTIDCGREELVLDAESVADVDLYIQDGLAGIRAHFEVYTTTTWPSQEQITDLSKKASGHFGFASTALRYIGDPTSAAPMAQFDHLLSFLAGVKTGSKKNPLEALDALYSGILSDIPDEILPMVKQILHHLTHPDFIFPLSSQILSNILRMDQSSFYTALRKFHSVLVVPSPEAAFQTTIQFYHASFRDYLVDSSRSGGVINLNDAQLDFAKAYLSWHQTDLELFHPSDGLAFDNSHNHGVLPGLKWASQDTEMEISVEIAQKAAACWLRVSAAREWDEALVSQIQNSDFRYIKNPASIWFNIVNKLWEVDPSNQVIRTEPQSETDLQLLGYMNIMTSFGGDVGPAFFPLQNEYGHYFFLGRDSKAAIFWTTGRWERPFVALNCDEAPSKEHIKDYQALFKRDIESASWGLIARLPITQYFR